MGVGLVSSYSVNKVGYQIVHNAAFRERLLADPASAIADFDLEPAERAALLAGEVGTLYQSGAHEFLLLNIAKFGGFGLTMPVFVTRMRAAGPRAHTPE
jgi:hypothetical protein